VRVPVLSLKIYEILPNSSGIVLFLAIVSGIDLSLLMTKEKKDFESTKFTLRAIGIMAQNKTINLKNVKNILE
jgi:hypothetical protein